MQTFVFSEPQNQDLHTIRQVLKQLKLQAASMGLSPLDATTPPTPTPTDPFRILQTPPDAFRPLRTTPTPIDPAWRWRYGFTAPDVLAKFLEN